MDIKNHASLLTGLVSYWRLDGDGIDSKDSHNGTVTGPTSSPTARFGSSYSFDGSNDYITLGTHADFEMSLMSASFWLYTGTANAGKKFITKRNDVTIQWSIEMAIGPKIQFVVKAGGSTYTLTDTVNFANWNTWTHVAVVVSATGAFLYVNGLLRAQSLFSATIDSSPTMPVLFGCRCANGVVTPGADYYTGNLDEIGIWNRGLTLAEVLDLYANGAGLPYENIERGIAGVTDLADLLCLKSIVGLPWVETHPADKWVGLASPEFMARMAKMNPRGLIYHGAPLHLNVGTVTPLKLKGRG